MSETSSLIVWMCWGPEFLRQAVQSAALVSHLDAHCCLITDAETARQSSLGDSFDEVVVADFIAESGHLRKTEIWQWLPKGYDVILFLDVDTRVLGDISLGFEKALKYGVAIAPAAHYCLDYFWGFERIMKLVGVEPRGQLQYNSGVIFFTRTDEVEGLFAKWKDLASEYGGTFDQPYLTLAMEVLDFRPYVLSPNYNYRGMSNPIIGDIRIWHSYDKVPAAINAEPAAWPMRSVGNGKFHRPGFVRRKMKRFVKRLIRRK